MLEFGRRMAPPVPSPDAASGAPSGLKSSLFLDRARAFADLKPHETADGHLITQLFGHSADVLFHGYFGITFHEALVHETISLIKFLEFAFDDLGNGLRRFAF